MNINEHEQNESERSTQKEKSGKKKYIVLFSVLAIIIGGGTAVAVSQRNNIAAARLFLNYSADELREQLADNEQRILESLEEHVLVPIQDLTDEEKDLLASDMISREEAVDILVERAMEEYSLRYGRGSEVAQGQNAHQESGAFLEQEGLQAGESVVDWAQSTTIQEQENLEALTSGELVDVAFGSDEVVLVDFAAIDASTSFNSYVVGLIAEVYVLRAYFVGRLEGLHAAAIAEFMALPEDQRDRGAMMEIGLRYAGIAGGLEAESDGMMADVTSRLGAELQRTGGDTSLVNEIMASYAAEKSIMKAYFMSLYS